MFCEKFTIIRHHTECSFPMQKWSRARLRYGIHFWWLPDAKGVWPGPIQEIRHCSFSFQSLRSLQTAFPSQVDYLQVARDRPKSAPRAKTPISHGDELVVFTQSA